MTVTELKKQCEELEAKGCGDKHIVASCDDNDNEWRLINNGLCAEEDILEDYECDLYHDIGFDKQININTIVLLT